MRNVQTSRRDSAIVAWHEVPGTWNKPAQKGRPVGYGVIRAGVRTDSNDWLRKFRTFQKEYYLKKHGAHHDEKYLWDELRRSYRTLRHGSFEERCSRHFVPGYDRVVPPGQDVVFSG